MPWQFPQAFRRRKSSPADKLPRFALLRGEDVNVEGFRACEAWILWLDRDVYGLLLVRSEAEGLRRDLDGPIGRHRKPPIALGCFRLCQRARLSCSLRPCGGAGPPFTANRQLRQGVGVCFECEPARHRGRVPRRSEQEWRTSPRDMQTLVYCRFRLRK